MFAKGLKFLLIFVLIEVSMGLVCRGIYFSQSSGKFARLTRSIKSASADIMIFGSSHANRHYIPTVIEKKTGRTCYNAGVQGQELLFHTALLKIILKRITPGIIVLNIDKNWLYRSDKAYDRLKDLHPYYWEYRSTLRPILSLKSKFIDLKLLSMSYQTNSTLVHAVRYTIKPQVDYKGYRPLYGEMYLSPENRTAKKKGETVLPSELDDNFISALKDFIKITKEKRIALVFCVSPRYFRQNNENNLSLNKIKKMALKNKVPILDFSQDHRFLNQDKLFFDSSHLNHAGADLLSEFVGNYLARLKAPH